MVSQGSTDSRLRGSNSLSDSPRSGDSPTTEKGWWSWSSTGGIDDEMGGWWSWAASYDDDPVRTVPAATRGMTPKEEDHLRRRIARLRKGGLFASLDANTTIERATTVEDLAEAYALVHDVYVGKGYMKPIAGGVRVRSFEALPEMATFVGKVDGKIVAVASIVPDSSDLGLPSDHVYPEELERLRQEPGTVFEITNLGVAPEYRNGPLFLEVTRAAVAHAIVFGGGNIFIAVSPGHTSFFHDVPQCEPWGSRRSYSNEVEDIVEGMRLCIPTLSDLLYETDRILGPGNEFLHAFYYEGNPYHDLVEGWASQAKEAFESSQSLRELFVFRSRFLLDCGDEELDAVSRRWGDRVYWGVWGEEDAPWARVSANLQTVS
jgi:hypothetical protein